MSTPQRMRRRARGDRLRRTRVIAVVMMATATTLAAAGVLNLARSGSDVADIPYAETLARWTVEDLTGDQAFLGTGVFTYRPNWDGPAQTFAGPVLVQVAEAQRPVRVQLLGGVIHRTAADGAPELTTGGQAAAAATATETTLARGDLVALAAGSSFAVATGEGETVRLFAVAVLPDGPPATDGIEQVEWRAWAELDPAPGTPLTVTIADLFLAGGESYPIVRAAGPALLAMDGFGDGGQAIAFRVTAGRGAYSRLAEVPAWNLAGPVAFVAAPTATALNRERAFDGSSGLYLPMGSNATVRNRSLVDGQGLRLVTFDVGAGGGTAGG